jgi:alpha-amylase/alpha-mannosidase (GH57 family)
MAEIALTFLWHQHQPYYPDDVGGDNPMPWVRLHGIKDYYGMALHLHAVPELRATINLVPSLLVQLTAYTECNATDRFLEATRTPADGLSEADCLYLLDHFFMANAEQMILPYPRYAELYHRRALGRNTAKEALRRFQERDFRDLQVWFNLTWVHPLARQQDDCLSELMARGRNFSEEDKAALVDQHYAILRRVLPLHRELAERGQVELTTTPFYHPILPLLIDKKLAKEAMPEAKLPRYSGGYPDDVAYHLRRAIEHHTATFGRAPRGMWPAEGSVCQEMVPLLARHGVKWIATDEEVLGATTHGQVGRDARGHVRHPEALYRAWKLKEEGAELGIVFRDHALSDLIGFHYQRAEPNAAADHFLACLQGIARVVTTPEPALVSVILDGENCWEHYPGGGVDFLRALYKRCTNTPDVRTMTIGEYFERYPPREVLHRLFPGSWINHNFRIWIGHEEDNTAWDALHRTREHLVKRQKEGGHEEDVLARAWQEIYIAEGSDWFWWFGDDHSSALDALFDYLFRKHLQNVYVLLGDEPPPELARPITRRAQRVNYTQPRAFLDVKVDGRYTFFEWVSAGRYVCQNERGTMALASQGPLEELYFGFSLDTLFIRIDCSRSARSALADFDLWRIGFIEPAGFELRVHEPGRSGQRVELLREGRPIDAPEVAAAVDQIAEAAVPFDRLGVAVEGTIHFFVELIQEGQGRDRAPREGTITLTRPSRDFEQIMWDV